MIGKKSKQRYENDRPLIYRRVGNIGAPQTDTSNDNHSYYTEQLESSEQNRSLIKCRV